MSKSRKFLVSIVIIVAAAWVFWPERWVAKGPLIAFITGEQIEAPKDDVLNQTFSLPEGFTISKFADVPGARLAVLTSTGDILVSATYDDTIYLLTPDADGDGVSDGQHVLLSGLNDPHGMALAGGYLYVAEVSRVLRYGFDAEARTITSDSEVIYGDLPPGGNHFKRTISFGPDGRLYLTIGSTCNVCDESDPRSAAMMVMNADGGDARIFATGLRNTVDFTWYEPSGALYGTDNARDLLGDGIPQDELNLIVDGGFYGWPIAYDNRVFDDYTDDTPALRAKAAASTVMAHGFGAHRAPLGIGFVRGEKLPEEYKNSMMAGLHGSWNSSVLVGYKVVSLHLDEDGSITEKDFMTGFLTPDEDVLGRPVDVLEGADGALYITDDYAGVVYRVNYNP